MKTIFLALALALPLYGLTLAVTAQDFHTDPACWDKPRVYHAGPPSTALARKVERTPKVTRVPRDNAEVSPNGAYKAWVEIPNKPVGNTADQILYVSSEKNRVTRFYIEQAQLFVKPDWINEKLVFVRIVWGRTVFSDLIIDAESGDLIYNEEARDGRNAFEQYKQACNNSCPCDLGGVDQVSTPDSVPAKDEVIGLVELPDLLNHDHHEAAPNTPTASLPIYIDNAGARVEFFWVTEPGRIQTSESGYEWAAANVYAREPGWYQIELTGEGKRKVWVRKVDTGAYTAMAEMLIDKLSYLDADWDGRLWKSPDGSGGYTQSAIKDPGLERQEYSARFVETVETGTGPWLKVQLLRPGHCDSGELQVIAEGWVPAWSKDGKLTGGYHSRGC